MKKLMNLKFKKGIQEKLNDLFLNEEYHQYTLGEFLKILAIDIVVVVIFFAISCI